MVRQGFSTVLITSFLGLLTIFSISNNPLILAYEVTDQNSEGVFSSLSRNFDKTLEEINNDEKSIGSEDQDSSANTANSNDDDLKNSTLASNPPHSKIEISNSTDVTDFESMELASSSI